MDNDFCKCKIIPSITTGFEDDFGYWNVCCGCGKRFEDGHHYCNHYDEISSNPIMTETSNIYVQEPFIKLEEEAKSLFGTMRDATKEELASVNRYIDSIAVNTGVNFFV